MTKGEVLLGYAVGTGEPVSIPVAHMAVTGMTQASGKTTTLAALIARSKHRAVTFITKRGEVAFGDCVFIQPFFRERADWVFVSSLIDATLGEKNKLLRAWLMKVCRGTKTLAQVQRNVRTAKASARGFSESIYTEIDGYLELVVPQLAQLPPVRAVKIGPGLNVMDLSRYSTELQALVIKSVLEHVADHERDVITVIPEAWEFLPEGRGSPVKREAESLIRKGAALRNFVWLDSQDLAGVWKLAVRAAAVYLIGVQREANEIKRTLANIPGGISKPKAADIATLERGQFFACWGRHVVKTYVQPAWMPTEQARAQSLAAQFKHPWKPEITAELVRRLQGAAATEAPLPGDDDLDDDPQPERYDDDEPEETDDMKPEQEAKIDQAIDMMTALLPLVGKTVSVGGKEFHTEDGSRVLTTEPVDEEGLFQRFKARLAKEAPAILKVLAVKPELRIVETTPTIELDGKTLRGRLARMIADGFFDDAKAGNAAFNELKRVGFKTAKPNVYRECDALAEMGFLTKESDGFHAVADMKRSIKRSAA